MCLKLIRTICNRIRDHAVISAFFILFISNFQYLTLYAQDNYFQQQVSYAIKVALDDKDHYLNGTITISYKNNSTDTLPFIWMHLWPNAYADRNTALSQQLLENGRKNLYFSKPEDRGFIDKLEFTVNGQPVDLKLDSAYKDIGKLLLKEPLLPGGSVEIATPFRVKIPSGKFSRLGHIGESYQISQWYPKPAVYDQFGWHQMPYLNQGEFYSEFGSFKVVITLPENYVVASTGILQEAQERTWLLEKAKKTEEQTFFDTTLSFPPSASKLKTITFMQDSIHDFAWFADKRFNVLKSEFKLQENGSQIDAWAFFTNKNAILWNKSLDYIKSGIRYYSEKTGAYPYSHYTAVDGTITAGGGMEYPMITVIGSPTSAFELENVIVHELGHSWFYGILGSNERDHGWMDEGINTTYEMGYIETKYPGSAGVGKNDLGGGTFFGALLGTNTMTYRDALKQAYKFSAFDNGDQPIETPSQDFTLISYGTVMYGKTALAFGLIEEYLGQTTFDSAMQEYFNRWKFKHPYPNDLKNVFEAVSKKNLDWFFDGIISTNHPVKYKITKTVASNNTLQVAIENKGDISPPVKLQEEGKTAQWIEGFSGEKSVVLSDYQGGNLKIYDGYVELLKRKGSVYRNRTILPTASGVRLGMFPKLNKDPNTETLLLLPMVAWNRYNEGMAGLVFSNFSFIPKHFEFSLTPLYDFKNQDIAGVGSVSYYIWPIAGALSKMSFSVQGKRFAYSENTFGPDDITDTDKPVLIYSKIAPAITVNFRKKNPRTTLQHTLSFRNISLWLDEVEYQLQDSTYQRNNVTSYLNFNELAYKLSNTRTLDPYSSLIRIEQGKNYCKLAGEFNYRFSYAKFNKGVDIRLFAGGFLDNGNSNSRNNNFRMNGWEGQHDYLYDELYFGRTDDHGFWKQQFLVRDGGFKTPTFVGQSNKWIAAINLDVDLPVPIPVSLFVGLGTYEGITTVFEDLDNAVMYECGIAIKPIRDILEIYVPLFYSDDINKTLELNGVDFVEQIRFVFNINNITPYAIRNRILEKY